jgi:hypothetical protein
MSNFISHTKNVCNYLKTSLCKDKPEFSRYWDARDKNPIDMITWQNRPERGLACMLSINLSYYPLFEYGELCKQGKIEIMAVCPTDDEYLWKSIIATSAYCVINGKWFAAQQVIFPNVVQIHNITSELKHIFFDIPFLYPKELSCSLINNIKTGWLMAIPISDAEYQYAIDHSVEDLGKLFEEKQIEYWDLYRKSIL